MGALWSPSLSLLTLSHIMAGPPAAVWQLVIHLSLFGEIR